MQHLKKTAIYQCLDNYFHRLKSKYDHGIRTKGHALIESIKADLNALSIDTPNLVPLENSVHRLMHTVYFYSVIRLLLHFSISHYSMMLAQTSVNGPSTKSELRCNAVIQSNANKMILNTYLSDVYLVMIHLGRVDCSLSAAYTNLITSCANMAKLFSETAKA
ncbi:MAG: hypothetical protein V3581_02645 [Candidatus Cardinium sp.]|uniref:hypothetical protein n=1 Tax=Candidatus Cardinium sp. TP TaxID=2961955 RepID=UPI0021AEC19A|nr:hypothetical protein [Candidatus Cardinium sp. TP]MCT4697174.1 hypothetical protein [Candidatus Cardinium sp. TP]MDN5247088.1 hypothetical protein [Candidatus Cardinium sp.]